MLDLNESVVAEYVDVPSLKEQAAQKEQDFSIANAEIASFSATSPAQLAGTPTAISTNKDAMQTVIDWYIEKNTYFTQFFEEVKSSTTDYHSVFVEKKKTVDELRKKVETERNLRGIRQEQVKSLENRNEANFHTSWMGLSRPLEEGSRVGLAVAAGAFTFLSILEIVYLYRTGSGVPDFSGFRGGFRSFRKGRSFV